MSAVIQRQLAPMLAGLAFFAVMAGLYCSHTLSPYYTIIRLWGIVPHNTPFLDTDTVMSALRCVRRGVDVFVTNPCDPGQRLFDYSPLWLVLARLPVTPAWLNGAGLLVDLSFFAVLGLLPIGRDRTATLMIAGGVLSSATLFAVERGNNDLVLFAFAALAAVLLLRKDALRYGGYALLLLCGLLKYYPMAAMAMALRERLPRFLWLAALSLLITAAFIITQWHDLSRALALIPTATPFAHLFGSITVGVGVMVMLDVARGWAVLIEVPMIVASVMIAGKLALRADTQAALAWLTPIERNFLIIGALYITGCFFTAQNLGYRAVHLLLVLPSLTALRHGEGAPRLRAAALVALALLWGELWRNRTLWLGHHIAGQFGWGVCVLFFWLVREGLWWWLVTQLLALVLAFALASPTSIDLRRWWPGRTFTLADDDSVIGL